MKLKDIEALLKGGATIEKGSFAGHWLRTADDKRVRLTATQALELIPLCTRIDDKTSRCGETWALATKQDAMTNNLSRTRADLDAQAQSQIAAVLSNQIEGVREESVHLARHGKLVTAITVALDDGFNIRCSVNGGKILVSVSDHTVQLQREEWRRSEVGVARAIGWILGYRAGYKQ